MKYLELIDNTIGLGTIGDLDSLEERIFAVEPEKLIELCEALRYGLPKPSKTNSPFRFVGNTEHSGLPYPCSSTDCRSNAYGNAILFAGMYADEFVLFNPFSNTDYMKENYADAVQEIAFYIGNIISAHPLIERGIITYSDFGKYDLCQSCFNRGLMKVTESSEKFNLYFTVVEKFLEETSVIYDGEFDDTHIFSIYNFENYGGHEIGGFFTENIKISVGDFQKGKPLTIDQVVQLGIPTNTARYISTDIIETNSIAGKYGIGNINSSISQIEMLKQIFGGSSFGDFVSVNYPFIAQSDMRKILDFRDSEWHHLHDFRKIVSDGVSSEDDVFSMFQDEEARIEKLIRRNSRIQNRKIFDSGIKIAAHATIALATSGVSTIFAAVAAAFGGKHLVDELVPAARQRLENPEEVRDSSMYYAWKFKKNIRKH